MLHRATSERARRQAAAHRYSTNPSVGILWLSIKITVGRKAVHEGLVIKSAFCSGHRKRKAAGQLGGQIAKRVLGAAISSHQHMCQRAATPTTVQTDVVVATALQCNVVAINRPIVTEFVHAVATDAAAVDDRSTFTKPPIFLSLAAFRVGMHSSRKLANALTTQSFQLKGFT